MTRSTAIRIIFLTCAISLVGTGFLIWRSRPAADLSRNVKSPQIGSVKILYREADSSFSKGYDITVIGQCYDKECSGSPPLLSRCETHSAGCLAGPASVISESDGLLLAPPSGYPDTFSLRLKSMLKAETTLCSTWSSKNALSGAANEWKAVCVDGSGLLVYRSVRI